MDTVDKFIQEWHNDTSYIEAHTSGSTGEPKTVHLAKADMEVSARATCRFFDIDSSSTLVLPLSPDYIAGKMMIVRSIVSGARLMTIQPSRGLQGLDDITMPIDLLAIVPVQIDALLKSDALPRVRNVIIGGAALSPLQEAAVRDSGICAYATYGMTETCSHIALRRIGYDEVYTAMPDVTFDVDENRCLIIRIPQYSVRRLKTNDVVELIDDRHFRWLGRRDNIINSGGIKIIPEEVERSLKPFLPECEYYLTSQPSQKWGEELVLVVEDPNGSIDVEGALREAAKTLPHHLLPKAIRRLGELPRTESGKIYRQFGRALHSVQGNNLN